MTDDTTDDLRIERVDEGPCIRRTVLASESYRQQCMGCVSPPRVLAVPGGAALVDMRKQEAEESQLSERSERQCLDSPEVR